jgi:hypothetical protein
MALAPCRVVPGELLSTTQIPGTSYYTQRSSWYVPTVYQGVELEYCDLMIVLACGGEEKQFAVVMHAKSQMIMTFENIGAVGWLVRPEPFDFEDPLETLGTGVNSG